MEALHENLLDLRTGVLIRLGGEHLEVEIGRLAVKLGYLDAPDDLALGAGGQLDVPHLIHAAEERRG